jgi:hypothetical protein
MNWAAITLVILLFVSAGVHIASHGKPREPYNALSALFTLVLGLFLYWQAGLLE